MLSHNHKICQKRTCQNNQLDASITKLVLYVKTRIMLRANVLRIKKKAKSENSLLKIQKTSKINKNRDTCWLHDESFQIEEWFEELIRFSWLSQHNKCFKYDHSIWSVVEFTSKHTERQYNAVQRNSEIISDMHQYTNIDEFWCFNSLCFRWDCSKIEKVHKEKN